MGKVQQRLAKHSVLQNKILTNKKNTIETLAIETIMRIDISNIIKSHCFFYKWNKKKSLEKIHKEQEEEMEAKHLRKKRIEGGFKRKGGGIFFFSP